MDIFYKCDPEKNINCPKDICQEKCFHTKHKEYALDKKRYCMDAKSGEFKEIYSHTNRKEKYE